MARMRPDIRFTPQEEIMRQVHNASIANGNAPKKAVLLGTDNVFREIELPIATKEDIKLAVTILGQK